MSCRECNDMGEIVVTRMTVNPYSGVPVHDPEGEDIVPCPRCSWGGSFPGGARAERLVRDLENDQRRAA